MYTFYCLFLLESPVSLSPTRQLSYPLCRTHWVCFMIDIIGQLSLFDSLLHNSTSEQLDIQLALLYRNEIANLIVTAQPLQKQKGIYDCGLYAIAVCIALANKQDPGNLRWRQEAMRTHLKNCILSEQITPLPSLQHNAVTRKLPKVFTIKLRCLCRLPEFFIKNYDPM